MDIVLSDVSLTVLEQQKVGSDIILINSKNMANGLWPYKGTCDMRIEVARGTANMWISDNFGYEILNVTTFKRI